MPIRLTPHEITARNRLWIAEVTPSDAGGQLWRTPRPMTIGDLIAALRAAGCSQADIDKALRETYARYQQHFMDERAEEEYGPTVRAALAAGHAVPPQKLSTEAWIVYALFSDGKPESIASVVDSVDAFDRSVPTADEVAWAFTRLKQRGWLVEEGALYGLTAEGRAAIAGIIGTDGDALTTSRCYERGFRHIRHDNRRPPGQTMHRYR